LAETILKIPRNTCLAGKGGRRFESAMLHRSSLNSRFALVTRER